eukprot:3192556-Rhodomonas_salina.1
MGAITPAQGHVSLILNNNKNSCSFDLHVALVDVSIPRREDVKVEELCVAHPHHALRVVDRESEVIVVEVLLRTTVQRIES